MIKNVISVIDGQAGSCGKGKAIGEIATDKTVNLGAAITNCMPNAGHTFRNEQGLKAVFKNIPVSTVNPKTELFIGPGSAINMETFVKEYKQIEPLLGDRKIYVHEMVPLIEERHRQYEREHIKSGSTFQGCGAVIQEKIIRDPNLQFFKTYKNAICCKTEEWEDRLYEHLDNSNEYVLLEGAQGCDLDLNHSAEYPYVTSRNVSTTQLLADSGISGERLLQTIMVIRPFPIRISNVTRNGEFIYSGTYGTGKELTWSQVNIASQYGGYPGNGDIEDYVGDYINQEFLRKTIRECPEIYLKQLFGEKVKRESLYKKNDISIIEALELERLMWKGKGITEYMSEIIDLKMRDLSEQTTVTKMERRIFNLDMKKLKRNCRINTPSSLYLNFFQHLNIDYEQAKGNFENFYFDHYAREYFRWLEENTNTEISALGTGSKNKERILKKDLIRR